MITMASEKFASEAAGVGEAAGVEHLEERVPDEVMRLLDLVEQDHAVGVSRTRVVNHCSGSV